MSLAFVLGEGSTFLLTIAIMSMILVDNVERRRAIERVDMLVFLENTWPVWWIFIVVVVLRLFHSACEHDEEFQLSADTAQLGIGRLNSWGKRPHTSLPGGHAA